MERPTTLRPGIPNLGVAGSNPVGRTILQELRQNRLDPSPFRVKAGVTREQKIGREFD